jgi:hypothetical protein
MRSIPIEHIAPVPLMDAALSYREAGLSVIATKRDKAPFFKWNRFQTEIAGEEELARMFMDRDKAERLAIVCGIVSGNLECLDFDAGGAVYPAWRGLVDDEAPGLADRLVVESSPRGGRHVVYRCPDATIPGATKLALRASPTHGNPKGQEVLVETRGEGSYFCCAPSNGYVLVQGDLRVIPEIDKSEREVLIRCARFLNELEQPEERPTPVKTAMPGSAGNYRPGDDYNSRCGPAEVANLLTRHGWRFWRECGPNRAWTRPGKDKGISATLRNMNGVEVFYVFSSSTAFAPARAYSPFQVYAILEHDGDFGRAATELNRLGFGVAPGDGFDALSIAAKSGGETGGARGETSDRIPDPGPFPERLLRVPGFLGEFSEYINRRAVKRQPVISLAAAIAALGTLAGRKVEGVTGLRTNFYILGVAESGDGKDKPREVVRQLLYESGNDKLYSSDRLKSDAGIRAALDVNPCTLFLLDEIGEMLETIKNARNSPWLKNIITELLTLYSAAQSTGVKLGGYADAKKTITVDCPHVCLFGTSVPKSVFRSMTMDSITGGLMGRLLIFESASENPRKQTPSREPIPQPLLEKAKWWREFQPGGNLTGNTAGSASRPMLIDESSEAKRIFDQTEEISREEFLNVPGDLASPYKRVEENARKLAILAACSENHVAPYIGVATAAWASDLAIYLTRRLVYLASINVAENDVHDKRNRVLRIIHEAGGDGISKSGLLRKCRYLKSRELGEVLNALVEANEVEIMEISPTANNRIQTIFKAC